MNYVLAELNIGRMVAPLDDPAVAEFVNNLVRINELADVSPGFVWRLKNDLGDSTSFRIFDDENIIINLTVWESVDALFDYAYKSEHVAFFRRRREWFTKMDTPSMVLWWIPADHRPTFEEAKERLDHLTKHGATPYAFTFKERFEPEAV